jgi:hypothetical protein
LKLQYVYRYRCQVSGLAVRRAGGWLETDYEEMAGKSLLDVAVKRARQQA